VTLGEIRWVDLAPRGGHGQRGRRPAIIVRSQVFSDGIPTVLVIPLTSQLDALRSPATVLVEADVKNGLRHASVALVFQLTALDHRYLSDRLGNISTKILEEILVGF